MSNDKILIDRELVERTRGAMLSGYMGRKLTEYGEVLELLGKALAASPVVPESVYPPCQGMNCGSTTGFDHSLECIAEHSAAIAGGVFSKPTGPDALATSPAAPITAFKQLYVKYGDGIAAEGVNPVTEANQRIAYLKSDIKARDAVLSIQDKRIAELEEDLRLQKQAVKWESDLCQQALESRKEIEAELAALRGQEPVASEFQSRDGTWHPFLDQKHYECTVLDGTWPIRALYTAAGAKGKEA